jgi:hypothetical protein
LTTIVETPGVQARFEKGLRRQILSYMPDRPTGQRVLSFDRREVEARHYVYSGIWFVLIMALFAGALAISTVMIYSPIYVVSLGVHAVLGSISTDTVNGWLYAACFLVLLQRVERLGADGESVEDFNNDSHEGKGWFKTRFGLDSFWNGLAKAAMFEEQMCREGCEEWSTWDRFKSCVIFGVMHLWNLFIPVGALIPLSTAGGYLMRRYLVSYGQTQSRESAAVESARYHYAFNRVALIGGAGVTVVYNLTTQVMGVHLF